MPPSPAHPPSVLDQAARGSRSTLLTQVVRLACKLASVVLLARLVTPAEHGIYAMAGSVTLFLFIFRDAGLGTAAVQAPVLSEIQLTSLLWAQGAIGLLLMLATLALAPAAAWFYATPEVTPLLALMSVSFLLLGLNGLPRAQLARALRFSELNRLESIAAVTGTAAMIAAAAWGMGPYSFAVFLLVSEGVMTVLAWLAWRWRPQAPANLRSLSELARTGFHITRYHALNYWLQQLDTFVVGESFGARALGLYSRASQILALANLHIAGPLTQVTLATLSRLGKNSPEFGRHVCATATMIAHFTLPFTAFCVALPEEMIRLVLGPQWPESAPLLRWLALSSAITTVTSLAISVNVASGQSRRLSLMVLTSLPVVGLAIMLGLEHGPIGVAIALAAANLILAPLRVWWALQSSPVGVADYGQALLGPLVVAVAFGVGAAGGARLAADMGWLTRLLVALPCGIAAAALLFACWPRVRAEWRYLRTHLPWGRAVRSPASL